MTFAAGCKSEKKITTYDNIYKEKPVTVYIAPVEDKTSRKEEKFPQDKAANEERNVAARYLQLTLPKPLRNQGYYTISGMSALQIAKKEQHTSKQLRNEDIRSYAQYYGIDALLVVTMHRWIERNGEWQLFIEYTLRSTKSNSDLLHTWVKATKKLDTDFKGDPIAMKDDNDFAEAMNMDNSTAQRCRLVARVNDYVLRNLPISSSKRQFEQDRYMKANAAYFNYIFTPDGSIDIEKTTMEAFEEECFVQ